MSIEFRCSQCSRLLRTGDDTVGRMAQCPECGAQTLVPAPEPTIPPSSTPPSESGFVPSRPGPTASPGDGAYHATAGPGAGPGYSGNTSYALQRVSAPGVCLIVIAVLSLVMGVLNILANILQIGIAAVGDMKEVMPVMFMGPVVIFSGAIGIIVAIVVLIGAIKMRRLETYWLAMTASILALIPCIAPCCIFGLPFGIWALVVLSDPIVKMSFKS